MRSVRASEGLVAARRAALDPELERLESRLAAAARGLGLTRPARDSDRNFGGGVLGSPIDLLPSGGTLVRGRADAAAATRVPVSSRLAGPPNQTWKMIFSKNVREDATVLNIGGELDAMTAPELRPTVDEIAQEQPNKVIVDLSGLRLIDSSGVGAIVSLFKRIRASGGAFEVVGVQGQPRSIFQVLRLDRVFNIR